ncbi:Cysteine-rich repeat-containing protein [Strongyloides ratti]|uniref:Cysteine-rich repeat-containing protein n=1 Tax=Strongyloides ratti TaxID=34506 RepID=A0A090LQD1_STRRB|nr:Cysteine-rich repeat-containing protein [Strongyloides ratti]CEF70391.1 Cysteine-rich repeat-containing protein [Strongyloides ratti]
MYFLKYRQLIFIQLFYIISVLSINECYYAWNERILPSSCSRASDCSNPSADCIFSLQVNQHICCAPKENAIFPKCPTGMIIASIGNHNSILCENEHDSDSCPSGYQCKESTTNFDKYEGQSNFVCCQ